MKLDCDTRESALSCVSLLFGAAPERVHDFLLGVDIETYYEENSLEGRYEAVLTLLLEREFGPMQELSAVSWFHLSHVLPGEDFCAGILPLDKAIDGVWATLERIFAGTLHVDNLRVLRREGVPNFHYQLKIEGGCDPGPFAILVGEAAFSSGEMVDDDYQQTPEIMRDICRGYETRFGLHIQDKVQAPLRRCVVKFTSDLRLDRWCTEAAVFYLYEIAHGRPMGWLSNTYFSGGGAVVPHSAIERVEFVDARS